MRPTFFAKVKTKVEKKKEEEGEKKEGKRRRRYRRQLKIQQVIYIYSKLSVM